MIIWLRHYYAQGPWLANFTTAKEGSTLDFPAQGREGVSGGQPAADYIVPVSQNKRQIRAFRFSDFEIDNSIIHHQINHNKCFKTLMDVTQPFKETIVLPETVTEWN